MKTASGAWPGTFTLVPDSFDHAPTGRTVAQMWNDGDNKIRRGMVRAVKQAWGMALVRHGGNWEIAIRSGGSQAPDNADGIIDLGKGLCFRRNAA